MKCEIFITSFPGHLASIVAPPLSPNEKKSKTVHLVARSASKTGHLAGKHVCNFVYTVSHKFKFTYKTCTYTQFYLAQYIPISSN